MSLKELLLDASELEPPEPFQKATALLRSMPEGVYLRMLHRRIPYPLFDHCKNLDLKYKTLDGKRTAYEIIIYYDNDETQLKDEGIL